jgi:uncharacterized protein (TIGR02231 family)
LKVETAVADAPIDRVVLFEDRVSVRRVVDIPQEAGRHTLQIGPLSALVRAEHLSFPVDAGIDVESWALQRQQVPQQAVDDVLTAELDAKLWSATERKQRAEQAQARCRAGEARADATFEVIKRGMSRALLTGQPITSWVAHLKQAESTARAHALSAIDSKAAALVASAEEQELTRRLNTARQAARADQVFITVSVRTSGNGTLRMQYTIPCGLWRPQHRAELQGDSLNWEVGAVVWNATGEDWTNVELLCSTARPGEHASLPPLDDDILGTQRREDIVVSTRDQTVNVAREGVEATADEVLGVDDGGEPRTFTAPKVATVLSNGLPTSIRLDDWNDQVTSEHRCHPERATHVAMLTHQRNRGTRPLLAGPVHLLRDGGTVGTSTVPFVGAGEPFSLGWGSEDGIRVNRRLDRTTERSRLTGHQTHRFKVNLAVTHVGAQPIRVRIRERIPVSELAEVTVPAPRATPPCDSGPDHDGFCDWWLQLVPGQAQVLTLDYSVEAPSRVTLP